MKRIIRVFPARTHATPDDDLVRINAIPSLFGRGRRGALSVAFTWHPQMAGMGAETMGLRCAGESRRPSLNEPGGDFIPGMYLKKGYVITSAQLPKPLLVLRCSQT